MAQSFKIDIEDDGSIILPCAVRDLLGVNQAGVVYLSIEGNEIKLKSIQADVKRAQALYKAGAACDFSSDDFLRERKIEVTRENLKD